ncbi:MAG: hypothetical protein RIB80_04685 [Rhodospirillales bacterium]
MGARGRESTAALSVVGADDTGDADPTGFPGPPADLSKAESAVWREVVAAKPKDWFTAAMFGTLAQLCRHRVRAKQLSMLIDKIAVAADFDVKEFRDLTRDERENTRVIESCETKLRLTPQTQYDKSKKGKASGGPAPWEAGE